MGGVGLAILTFVFGLQPTAPPIDVMLMIAAVISAASCMQAAGGLDYMVKLAEHLLRKNPSHVTLLSPLVTYLFTFVAGTGHVAYSVLPVIAEVATEQNPSGTSVGYCRHRFPTGHYGKSDLCRYRGTSRTFSRIRHYPVRHSQNYDSRHHHRSVGRRLFSMRIGKELVEDPEYQKRLKEGLFNIKRWRLKVSRTNVRQ